MIDSFPIDLIMQELKLRLLNTFAGQLLYLGTTSTPDEEFGDIDVLVVLTQMSDKHIRHVMSIIHRIKSTWNVVLDCRIRTAKDITAHPRLEAYLLGHFLKDCHGKNPFTEDKDLSDELTSECLDRIKQQEHRILARVPQLMADNNKLREIGQCVYDAIRAFLILENKARVSKRKACETLCEISPAFDEAKVIYEGASNPQIIFDIPGYIANSLALVKHLSYRAQIRPIEDKVLLVNTPSSVMPHPLDNRLGYDANMPLGIVCLASYLKQKNIPVEILDAYAKNLSALGAVDEIMKSPIPRIIGFNAASPNIDVVHQIAKYLKRISNEIIVVCGGPHATLSTKHTLSNGFIDYAIAGEGEIPFINLVKTLLKKKRGKVKGIEGVYQVDVSGKVIGKPNKTPFPLEELPLPSFDLLPLDDAYFVKKRRLYLHTTRGCGFKCVYCSVRKFWGGKVRRVPLSLLFQHLEELSRLYQPDEIQIVDDNFSHEKGKIIEEFCEELIERKLSISWKCQVRADQLNPGIISLMKKTGCFEVDIGVESGNREIQKAIKKGLNLELTRDVVGWLKNAGIIAKAFFILGFPNESYGQLADTINYAITLKNDGLNDVAFFPAMPFPGTELADNVEKDTGKKVVLGAVMDHLHLRPPTFASRRLHKYSAMPEFAVNALFTPQEIRLLVHFAYEKFDEGTPTKNLESEFKEFLSREEAYIYAT